jgi:hypothetical protein
MGLRNMWKSGCPDDFESLPGVSSTETRHHLITRRLITRRFDRRVQLV